MALLSTGSTPSAKMAKSPDFMTDDFPFWTFSLDVYGGTGVPDACLALQEAHGIDVNLLLFCCWAGECATVLDDAAMTRCLAAAGAWHGVIVRGLRGLRRRLKDGFDPVPGAAAEALRQKILGVELAAEKIEQGLLAHAVPLAPPEAVSSPHNIRTAAANVAGYFSALGLRETPADRAHVLTVLCACFPEVDAEAIAAEIDAAFS
jgi:uncharacterized protein (TIGR02444 family)